MRSGRETGCVRAEHLERITSLPFGDARRRHVGRCLRCRVTLALVREFRAPRNRRAARARGLVTCLDAMVEAIVVAPA